ncbi:hypothetical protein BC831DRAFT_444980 [Entophlyctis helioformis]|nr:hypothetical protein BC831DRAFT_444980 [Entophlyctis helioformis]
MAAEFVDVTPSEPFMQVQLQLLRPSDDGADCVVSFAVATNLPEYARTHYTITRTLTEFDRLHLYLARSNPELIAPAAPPKSQNLAFLRLSLDTFLQRLSMHPQLRVADPVRTFIESEFQFVPPVSPPALRRAQKSLFSFSSSSGTKEIDVFYDNARKEVLAFDGHFSAIGRINEKISLINKDVGRSCAEVAVKMVTIGADRGSTMSLPFRKTSKCFAIEDEVISADVQFRQGVFNDQCLLLLRGSMGAQTSLDHRLASLEAYEASCKATSKKVQMIDRLRSSGSIRQDKVDAALEELAESKRVESECRETFKKLSESLRKDYERYRGERTQDAMEVLDGYARQQLDMHKQLLNLWQTM